MKFPKQCYGYESKMIIKSSSDSIKTWRKVGIEPYSFLKETNWFVDSLIAFNSDTTRMVCAYLYTNEISDNHDGMTFFYGEKINKHWYFFKGPGIVIPREIVKDHPVNQPLSYAQLHQIALKEVYAGYLKEDGSINEEWFESHFSQLGLGIWSNEKNDYINPQTKSEYQKALIASCKGLWLQRYNPYKASDFTLTYIEAKKTLNVKAKLQTPDTFYLNPLRYKLIYKHSGINYLENSCSGSNFCDIKSKKEVIDVTIKNVPCPGEIELFIEQEYYPNVVSQRMGPVKFKIENENKIIAINTNTVIP